jgi:hypothetical protein
MGANYTFYKDITAFHSFGRLVDRAFYQRVPSDWLIVITDVKGSTKAIESGRYRDVNTIGASVIASVQNLLSPIEFPFVFGGDGATLVIPPVRLDAVKGALVGLRRLARDNFGLDLRVGLVAVGAVEARGAVLEVAKYELTHGKAIAMFRGGALTLAEDLIKNDERFFEVQSDTVSAPNLNGLSCRWNAIPTRKGKVLSLLIRAEGLSPDRTYRHVLNKFDEILHGRMDGSNPVALDMMSYKGVTELLREECRMHGSKWSPALWYRVVEIVAAVFIFRHGLHPLFFSPQRYAKSMKDHSDFLKFDDMLRMTLDVSPAEADAIETLLLNLWRAGHVRYGLHVSDASLMTCLVQNLNEGGHLHFIDGEGGGYAMAAKAMKSQVIELAEVA